jgi:hypothetical protein
MRRSIVLAVVLPVVLAGCIGGDPPTTNLPATPGTVTQTDSPAGESPPSGVESPDVVVTASPSPDAGGGQREPTVFARRETPPGGVADFLGAIPGGGIEGPCIVNPPEEGQPGVAMHTTILPTSLCGLGFAPGEPIELLLRAPGGREWTAETSADDGGGFEWELRQLPRRLQGEYFAQASQGEISVDGTFDVRFESLTAAVVPRRFAPGRATELVIAGGEPRQRVPVHLYRERKGEADGWDFIADLGPVRLNDNGQVRIELDSRRRDEQGTYMVLVEPDGARIGYWFVLGDPGGG